MSFFRNNAGKSREFGELPFSAVRVLICFDENREKRTIQWSNYKERKRQTCPGYFRAEPLGSFRACFKYKKRLEKSTTEKDEMCSSCVARSGQDHMKST